jgi:endogenous inhibitor of DNA gyrase (YacG/DUF329 family)
VNSLDDFASCGSCGKVVYIARISAPEPLNSDKIRNKVERAREAQDRISRAGIGPGVCPECGKDARFMSRRYSNSLEEQRREEKARMDALANETDA